MRTYTNEIMCILFCVLYFDCTNIISHALGILLQSLQAIKEEEKKHVYTGCGEWDTRN